MNPQLSSALVEARTRDLRQPAPRMPSLISRLLAARTHA